MQKMHRLTMQTKISPKAGVHTSSPGRSPQYEPGMYISLPTYFCNCSGVMAFRLSAPRRAARLDASPLGTILLVLATAVFFDFGGIAEAVRLCRSGASAAIR